MDAVLDTDAGVSPSVKWSVYAGLCLFGCATVTAVLLADVLALFAEVVGLPARYAMVLLASPALLVGTVTWWAVVERRRAYAYRVGGAVGLLTALLTGLLWTARFVTVWGVEMLAVPIVAVLVLFVLGITAVAGVLVGLPLMYARRRTGGLADGPK
jgi:hypothetical protein